MTDVTGLQMSEAARVAAQFGVSIAQVRRDHLSSLILAALGPYDDELQFFGGFPRVQVSWPDSTTPASQGTAGSVALPRLWRSRGR